MKLQRSVARCASHVFLGLGILGILTSIAAFTAQNHHTLAEGSAFVRVIHASPFIGAADVFVDGAPLLSSFQFGSVTNYVAVPPGAHKVQIALVGKGINASVITQTLDVSPGIAYTVAAIGAQPTNLALKAFIDHNQLTPGSSKLRVYHLSPDSGSLNVGMPAKTLITDLPYQGTSGYLTIAPGTYQFDVTAPASNVDHSIQATLSANKITSIFAVGLFNGTPSFELISAQVNGLPQLPNTGSDPNTPALPAAGQPPTLWLIGLLCTVSFLFLSGWGYMRILARKLK
jgi:hypothetical protein